MRTLRAQHCTALLVALSLWVVSCTSDEPGVTVDSSSSNSTPSNSTTLDSTITQSTELIPFDDEVRTGTLENGLKYFIRESERPGRKAELRLAIDAGSALEDGAQSGVAHFLEHMMFNGTEKYEKNEIIELLQQSGVEFGADINAYTSYDETVYQLTVGTDNDELELGLDILHQWLTAATLTDADVTAERGVVLDEYRTRELTAEGRVFSELETIFLGDTAYEDRSPIGTPEGISEMTPELLRRYYDAWYRPDNAAIIVVGEIDVGEIEERIEELFGGVEPRGEGPERPVLEWTGKGEARVEVIADPDLIEGGVELASPAQDRPRDTVGLYAQSLVDYIATAAIANRMEGDIDSGDAQFSEAIPSSSSYVRALDAPSVYVVATSAEVAGASAALLDEYARVIQFGLSEADVQRVVTEIRASVDAVYDKRDTVQAATYADQLVSFHLDGVQFPSAKERYDLDVEILDAMSAELVNDAFRARLEAWPPALVITAKEGTEDLPVAADLVTELNSLATREVGERAAPEAVGDQLMEAPDAAEVVSREAINGVPGAYIEPTEVTFANGVRVIINPSSISDDFVLLQGVSPGGMSVTEPDDAAAAWLMNEVNSESGFGSLSRSAVNQILAASTVDVFPYVSESTELIVGSTSTNDLELAFQVLNQYISASNFDQVALDDAVDRNLSYISDLSADAGLAVQHEMNDARYGDDPRYRVLLTEPELTSITTDDLARVWNARFGNAGDFVFILSGDLDLDTTIELAARYLGTLPSTGETETALPVSPPPPPGIEARTVFAGSGDTASLSLQYTTPTDASYRESVLAGLLTTVLTNRLTAAIREELGASYSPRASVSAFGGPQPETVASILISGSPAEIETISDELQANLVNLREDGPTSAEFSAAVAEAIDAYGFVSDEQIVRLIERWLTFESTFEDYDKLASLIDDISADDLREYANQVFPPDHYISITQLPR